MPFNLFLKEQPPYSDLDLDFFPHPATKDISMKIGEEAIKRSVRNILFTNFYEKPFQPRFGCSVRSLLFENCTQVTASLLHESIMSALVNHEPRILVNEVRVTADPDNNGFNVHLDYVIRERQTPMITSLFLERIR